MYITFAIAKTIPKSLGVFKHILKDVFEGLQDEELRHVRIKEIVDVVFQIIIFAMQDIGLSDEEEKN